MKRRSFFKMLAALGAAAGVLPKLPAAVAAPAAPLMAEAFCTGQLVAAIRSWAISAQARPIDVTTEDGGGYMLSFDAPSELLLSMELYYPQHKPLPQVGELLDEELVQALDVPCRMSYMIDEVHAQVEQAGYRIVRVEAHAIF